MKHKCNAIYRVDGGCKIGMGHIIRSVCVTKEILLPLNIKPFFIVKCDTCVKGRLKKEGFDLCLLQHNSNIRSVMSRVIKRINPKLILTDVPKMQHIERYEEIIKDYKMLHIVFDDLYLAKIKGDIIIDGSMCIKKAPHTEGAAKTRYLRGSKYAVISKQFRKARKAKRIKKEVNSIVLSLGGSDPRHFTYKVLKGLCAVKSKLTIHVVLGPAFKARNADDKVLHSIAGSKTANKNITLYHDTRNFADIISGSDLAIVSGGITLYETACIGVPSIIVCQTSEQNRTAEEFEKMGISINCGYRNIKQKEITETVNMLMYDYEKRKNMAKRGKTLVDGKGAERIKEIFLLSL